MKNISSDIYQYQPLWGKWHIDELIGQGVFGKVYRISHQEYGHTYTSAVKMISIPNQDQYIEAKVSIGNQETTLRNYFNEMVQSLVNEVNILYALSGNSNILGYHDHKIIEHKDGIGWDILIRMEYVKSLSQYLTEKQMTQEEAITLGIDLCSALDICSRHGIIHRDIKDENIFINDDGVFKLGDFGIAMRLSTAGRTALMQGTPHYMAPEVFHGEKYDAAVDIYSLGIVMYRLFNHCRLPFMPPYPDVIKTGDSEKALVKRMSGEQFQMPDQANQTLSKIIMKACSYRAENRYTSPGIMKHDLERVLHRLADICKKEFLTVIDAGSAKASKKGKSPVVNQPDQRGTNETQILRH